MDQLTPFWEQPLASLDLEAPLPPLWPLFEGLKPMPVLAIQLSST